MKWQLESMMTSIHLLGLTARSKSKFLHSSVPNETVHLSGNQRVEGGVTPVALMPNYLLGDVYFSCSQAGVCRIRSLSFQKGYTFARRHQKNFV